MDGRIETKTHLWNSCLRFSNNNLIDARDCLVQSNLYVHSQLQLLWWNCLILFHEKSNDRFWMNLNRSNWFIAPKFGIWKLIWFYFTNFPLSNQSGETTFWFVMLLFCHENRPQVQKQWTYSRSSKLRACQHMTIQQSSTITNTIAASSLFIVCVVYNIKYQIRISQSELSRFCFPNCQREPYHFHQLPEHYVCQLFHYMHRNRAYRATGYTIQFWIKYAYNNKRHTKVRADIHCSDYVLVHTRTRRMLLYSKELFKVNFEAKHSTHRYRNTQYWQTFSYKRNLSNLMQFITQNWNRLKSIRVQLSGRKQISENWSANRFGKTKHQQSK